MAAYLLNSPAEVVAYLIIAKALGTQVDANEAWPVAVGDELNEPDDTITTYDTGSQSSDRDMVTGQQLEQYSIQVRVRSKLYTDGWLKLNEIAKVFDEDVYLETITIGDNTYRLHAISRRGGVLSLGREYPASQRSLFVMTGQCAIRQVLPLMTKETYHASRSRRSSHPGRSKT
jgi:hypothetical protein